MGGNDLVCCGCTAKVCYKRSSWCKTSFLGLGFAFAMLGFYYWFDMRAEQDAKYTFEGQFAACNQTLEPSETLDLQGCTDHMDLEDMRKHKTQAFNDSEKAYMALGLSAFFNYIGVIWGGCNNRLNTKYEIDPEKKLGCLEEYLIKTLLFPFSCWGGRPFCGLLPKDWCCNNWWIGKPAQRAGEEDPLTLQVVSSADSPADDDDSSSGAQRRDLYSRLSPIDQGAGSPSSRPACAGTGRSSHYTPARDNVTSDSDDDSISNLYRNVTSV